MNPPAYVQSDAYLAFVGLVWTGICLLWFFSKVLEEHKCRHRDCPHKK